MASQVMKGEEEYIAWSEEEKELEEEEGEYLNVEYEKIKQKSKELGIVVDGDPPPLPPSFSPLAFEESLIIDEEDGHEILKIRRPPSPTTTQQSACEQSIIARIVNSCNRGLNLLDMIEEGQTSAVVVSTDLFYNNENESFIASLLTEKELAQLVENRLFLMRNHLQKMMNHQSSTDGGEWERENLALQWFIISNPKHPKTIVFTILGPEYKLESLTKILQKPNRKNNIKTTSTNYHIFDALCNIFQQQQADNEINDKIGELIKLYMDPINTTMIHVFHHMDDDDNVGELKTIKVDGSDKNAPIVHMYIILNEKEEKEDEKKCLVVVMGNEYTHPFSFIDAIKIHLSSS